MRRLPFDRPPGHNGIGPSLNHAADRQSGTEPGYHYPSVMASAHITWTDATLERFLSNPQGLVYDTKMFVGVPDARQRQDTIAYFATLK